MTRRAILLRISEQMHQELKDRARADERSMNQIIIMAIRRYLRGG